MFLELLLEKLFVRTVDLMKKGLRRSPRAFARETLRQNRRPDEEGIKTVSHRSIQSDARVRTVDLMKKGLRHIVRVELPFIVTSEP